MRTYTFQGQTIEVEFRPFGVFLWLVAGFEVRVGGRSFLPKFDGISFNTTTEFDFDINGTRISGIVRSLAPMWLLPRMNYTVSVSGLELARDRQTLRRWYLSYLAWAAVIATLLLALLGSVALAIAVWRLVTES